MCSREAPRAAAPDDAGALKGLLLLGPRRIISIVYSFLALSFLLEVKALVMISSRFGYPLLLEHARLS